MMKLEKTILEVILILGISLAFISCEGQNESSKIENPKDEKTMGQIVSELDNDIWKIFQDQEGNYWFGSNGRGIYKYDGLSLRQFTTEDGLIDNTIRGFREDKHGNIYIETPEGISKFNGKSFTTLSPVSSQFNQWKLDPNDLWFGYNANDLYRYDGDSLFEVKLPRQDLNKAFGRNVEGVPFEANNNSPYAVYGVDIDKEGNLWIGTVSAGAFRYDGQSLLWFAEQELSTLPDGRVPGVRSMIEDKDGYFWLSNFVSKYKVIENESGPKYEKIASIKKYTGDSEEKLPYFLDSVKDENNDIWMACYGSGVWKYDGKKLINIPAYYGETELLLMSIIIDKQGSFWLGSQNAGVFKFDGESFEKFRP